MDHQFSPDGQLYTCLSCSIAFLTPEDQRVHYRSDHHRYNMKRRVASLPPISVAVFNQKVIERRTETAIMSSAKGSSCEICNKIYTTENAYRSHIQSKKHKENEVKAAMKPKPEPTTAVSGTVDSAPEASQSIVPSASTSAPSAPVPTDSTEQPNPAEAPADADAEEGEDEVMKSIDEKIAAARARLAPTNCLFCPQTFSVLDENLTHMSIAHSFFIPDAEYLIDINGVITYLGEKIAVGNVCIYCNDKGRGFRSLDAVRKHMLDKAHCKIAYEKERDRMELSDFYDFSSSYPDAQLVKEKKEKKKAAAAAAAASDATVEDEDEEDEWEEASDVDDEDVDEIVDDEDSDETTDSDSEDDLPPANEMSYGDSPFELVLPSGARIGHRTMKRYYDQSLPAVPRGSKPEDPNSGAALVRRLLSDKNSALVPVKGAFGAFGMGTQVVKARNRGEAREAGRHVREFRDMKRREDFKTKVGFVHNSQKHYRDPLLQ